MSYTDLKLDRVDVYDVDGFNHCVRSMIDYTFGYQNYVHLSAGRYYAIKFFAGCNNANRDSIFVTREIKQQTNYIFHDIALKLKDRYEKEKH